ncbi:MAG: glycoside hydrolase family 32 protein [Mangrovibacterium sp.]
MTRYAFLLVLGLSLAFSGRAQNSNVDQTANLRPQFHFTTNENYVGSPAAALYSDKLFHLFYEYSPVGNGPEYLNLGHAVSADLINWKELRPALTPDDDTRDLYRCTVRPGSALVDAQNLLKKQKTDTLTQVVFYTSYQCGIRMAYSSDGGKSWTKHTEPLVPYMATENARNPKVFWYAPNRQFVMLLARKQVGLGEGVSFYTSVDLLNWEYQSHLMGSNARPDFFELPVDGNLKDTRWVLTDSIGTYSIGQFDGKRFQAEADNLKVEYGFCSSTTSWTTGEGTSQRRLQIGSLGGNSLPGGTAFAGQLSFPAELSLHQFPEGIRLVKKPAEEIARLETKPWTLVNKNILPGLNKNPVSRMKGDCFRIKGTFDLKTVNSFGFLLRSSRGADGTEIRYDATRNQLSVLGKTAPLAPEGGKIELDILVDRSSVEVYASGGRVVLSGQFAPAANAQEYLLYNTGGELLIEKLEVTELKGSPAK